MRVCLEGRPGKRALCREGLQAGRVRDGVPERDSCGERMRLPKRAAVLPTLWPSYPRAVPSVRAGRTSLQPTAGPRSGGCPARDTFLQVPESLR